MYTITPPSTGKEPKLSLVHHDKCNKSSFLTVSINTICLKIVYKKTEIMLKNNLYSYKNIICLLFTIRFVRLSLFIPILEK